MEIQRHCVAGEDAGIDIFFAIVRNFFRCQTRWHTGEFYSTLLTIRKSQAFSIIETLARRLPINQSSRRRLRGRCEHRDVKSNN